jgi:hypothetical protein
MVNHGKTHNRSSKSTRRVRARKRFLRTYRLDVNHSWVNAHLFDANENTHRNTYNIGSLSRLLGILDGTVGVENPYSKFAREELGKC